jgi:hypothetical protein
MSYLKMSYTKIALPALAVLLIAASAAAGKKPVPPPPAPATTPSPAVTDDFVRKEFGDNCSVLPQWPQFVGDMDGDGVDDLIIVARCKNPMADRSEYNFSVSDPYNTFLGFGDVKVTSTFASDAPERRGVDLLIVHGVGKPGEKDAWRSSAPKTKFMLINVPFKTMAVKRLATHKRTVLGIFIEEQGEGEDTSSVIFWDGKKYRYQQLGATLE